MMKRLLILFAFLLPQAVFAIGLNQAAVVQTGSGYEGTPGTPFAETFTFGSAVGSGDTVVAVIDWNHSSSNGCSLYAVTDSKANAYTLTALYTNTSLPGQELAAYAVNVSNSPVSVTVEVSCTVAQTIIIEAAVYDVTGLGAAPTLDFNNGYTAGYNSGTVEQTFSFSTTQSNEIGFAIFTDNGNDVTSTTTWTSDGQTSGERYWYGAHSLLSNVGSNSISATPASGSTEYGFYVVTLAAGGSTGNQGQTVFDDVFPFAQWQTVSTNTVLAPSQMNVLCNAASGTVTITLPSATTSSGTGSLTAYKVEKIDSSSNACNVVSATTGQTVRGVSAYPISTPCSNTTGCAPPQEFRSDGANWW